MELLYVLYAAVFYVGTILGSFLNVIALDIQKLFTENDLENRNEWFFFSRHVSKTYFWRSLMSRRSHCDTCDRTLRTFELFPIFSYLLQRGKCKQCGTSIDASHLWVELLCGVYFLGIFHVLFWQVDSFSNEFMLDMAFWVALFGMLFVLALFDYRTKLIPDVLVFGAGALALLRLLMVYPQETLWHIGAAIVFAGLFWGLWLFSRGAWIGFADGKLAIVIGLLFGFSLGFSALAYGFWIGTSVIVLLFVLQRLRGDTSMSLTNSIPLGPYLVAGAWVAFVWNINMFALPI